MAFPTTPIIDDFNRADGNLDTRLACSNGVNSWFLGKINGGSQTFFDIVSGQLKDNSTTADSFITASFGPDVEAYVSLPVLPTSYIFLAARIKDENTVTWDGYGLLWEPVTPSWQLRRYDNGGGSILVQQNGGLSAGDKVGLSVVGSLISAYRYTAGSWNQTPIVTFSDATYAAAGKIGIEVNDTTARLDDFGGGTYIAPAAGDLLVETPWRTSRGVSW